MVEEKEEREPKRLYQKLPREADKFVSMTGTVTKLKKQAKVFSDIKLKQINTMLLGPSASGKTLTVVGLLKNGLKVLHINTDIGGTGLMTVQNALREEGLEHLGKNLVSLDLDNYEEVFSFLNKPTDFFPQIYTFGINVLFWDGFDNFQHSHIGNKIADMVPERDKVSEGREAGLQMEVQDWGMIKTGTLKALDRFFRMNNKVDGTIWHKIITCKPKYIQRKPKPGEKTDYVEIIQPNLSGASQIIMSGGFDLIIYCKMIKSLNSEDVKYVYFTKANPDNCCKSRGFDLAVEEPADFEKFWKKISVQAGISTNDKNEELIER